MVASNVATLSELEHGIQLRRAVIAATVGTAIEWYDFFLYSVVTGLVFAQLYFPKSDPLVGCGLRRGVIARDQQDDGLCRQGY
jgi:hypothetical protein